jgi:drug/metabolite transporter (DMT)-like permease
MLMALLVGRRIFRERANRQELIGQALVAVGILLIVRVGLG